MCACTRRQFLVGAAGAVSIVRWSPLSAAPSEQERTFIVEAERMRAEAVAAGDQPFGAVIVMNGQIVGYGPSRVVTLRNPDAHAERVAIWDAQKRVGRKDLSGAIIYSTSRPCSACEDAAALANVDRMLHGPAATDAGKPRRR
jgi:tRNA(Arg) A34 adenosine deaminase TadA